MSPAMTIVMKALAGGVLVVVFALISEVLKPKEFAGLFAAAPSVAVASLAVTWADRGAPGATTAALGMIAGGVAMAVYCVVGVYAVRRWRAKAGSIAAAPVWFLVAFGAYMVFLR